MDRLRLEETEWPPDFPRSIFLGRAAKQRDPNDVWSGLRSGELEAQVYCVGRTDFDPVTISPMAFLSADRAQVLSTYQIEFREIDRRRSVRIRRAIPVPHWLYVTKESFARFAKNSATSTVGEEGRATAELAAILRREPNISKSNARKRLSHYAVTGQGFDNRVWPNARTAADLPTRQSFPLSQAATL